MTRVSDFELVDHGIDHSQYFQGCGVSFTSFANVVTGAGYNPAEAIDDALEQMAMNGVDVEGMEKRILKDAGRRTMPKRPVVGSKYGDECYYYVSIRYNLEGATVEV